MFKKFIKFTEEAEKKVYGKDIPEDKDIVQQEADRCSMFYIVETQIELNLNNTFLAIVFFGVFANLSGIVPSTSGGWGPFDLIGTIVLISFGADRKSAAAFTIIVHLILWLPISIIGLICFLYDLKGRNT